METADVMYPRVISNRKENTEDEILKLILKDFDKQTTTISCSLLIKIFELHIKSGISIVEDKEDVSSLLVAEDGKMDGKWELEDRMAIAGDYCVNGTEKIGNYCMPVDD